jgi:phage baseplate assembly protein W
MTLNVAFPYQPDAYGRTMRAGPDDHIRDLVELVLFTAPGERVNRPDFGSGLLQLVFDPNGPQVAAAVQMTAQAALVRWLGDLIDVQSVEAESVDSQLTVTVRYIVRRSQRARVETFQRGRP